jgi:HEAT repeat protein
MRSGGRFGSAELIRAVCCAAAALLAPSSIAATVAEAPGIGELVVRLSHPKWDVRSDAFYSLLKLGAEPAGARSPAQVKPSLAGLLSRNPQQADDVRIALIKTLEIENRVARSGAPLTEDFTGYYGDLIQAVGGLNDERSVNALAGALGTGNMANSALVALGDKSVDAVIRQLEQATDRTVRQSACTVLERMSNPASRNPIRNPEHARRVQQALGRPPCARQRRD